MSREIKFRAWDGENIRYDVTGMEHGTGNEMSGAFLDGDYYRIVDVVDQDKVASPPEAAIMQFTGLHDRSGAEIYEGDIVAHENVSDIEQVYFNTTEACFACKGSPSGESWMCEGYTVIGNIHENPDLLNQEAP